MASLYTDETTSGTVTAFFPLTAFDTASSCSNKYSSTKGDGTLYAFPSKATCAPVALSISVNQGTVTSTSSSGAPMPTTTLLGPLECSGIYSTASTSVLDVARTSVICCPSGFDEWDMVNGTAHCTSTAPSGTSLKVDIYTTKSNGGGNAETGVTLKTGVPVVALAAQGWKINQAGVSKPTATSASDTTSPSPDNIQSVGSSSGTSARVKVGVGVGVGLGGAIVIALLALFFYRRGKRQKAEMLPETAQSSIRPNELQGDDHRPEELEGSSRFPYELQGSQPQRFELDGGH